MESFSFSQDVRIIGGVILVVLILYLYHRNASSTNGRSDFSEPARASGSVGRTPEYKLEYIGELSRAVLFLDGGQAQVVFSNITDVEVDEIFPEITLKRKTGKATFLSLGVYDLLISRGEPATCEVREAFQVRVWAREKLVYNESLAGVELCDGYLIGYTYDGSDVCLVFGSGLTLCAEEV